MQDPKSRNVSLNTKSQVALRMLQRNYCQVILKFILTLNLLLLNQFSQATTISLNILDGANEGLNDNTPASPTGGNTGVTIGEQRQLVFEYAATLMSAIINSSVDIMIDTKFDPLTCSASSATLGSAGPNSVHFDSLFTPIPLPETATYYVQALANAFNGSDLSSQSDINMTFNSEVDNNNSCLNNRNWYYGLDGNVPGSDIDFLSTVLHEMQHGLGFLTLANLSNGVPLNNRDDIYMFMLEDHEQAGDHWNNMTNAERTASAINDPDLHWDGANVQVESGGLTSGTSGGHVRMNGPSTLKIGSSVSHFSTTLSPFELMEPQLNSSVDSIGLAQALLKDIGWTTFINNHPIVAGVDDLTILNGGTEIFDFAIMDNDTSASNLVVTASSSNISVIENNALVLSGTGRLRQLSVTPLIAVTGSVDITITVSDGTNSNNTQFNANVVSNLPPTVSISSPIACCRFITGPQNITASASDPEQGNLDSAITWSSSIDGPIGTGPSIDVTLTDGNHSITASVSDNETNTSMDSLNVEFALMLDDDGDGLTNSLEIALNTNPDNADTDNDFLSDFAEVNMDGDPSNFTPGSDTDPNNQDTDGDGKKDGLESEPLIPNPPQANIPFAPLWSLAILLSILATIRARSN